MASAQASTPTDMWDASWLDCQHQRGAIAPEMCADHVNTFKTAFLSTALIAEQGEVLLCHRGGMLTWPMHSSHIVQSHVD
jgi:hypothetical protein